MEYYSAIKKSTFESVLMRWMKLEPIIQSEVSQKEPTLCDPIDGSPPGSAVHGILQARTLEWVAISFSITTYSIARPKAQELFQSLPIFTLHIQFFICSNHILKTLLVIHHHDYYRSPSCHCVTNLEVFDPLLPLLSGSKPFHTE